MFTNDGYRSSLKLLGRAPPNHEDFVMDERHDRSSLDSVQQTNSLGEKRKVDL